MKIFLELNLDLELLYQYFDHLDPINDVISEFLHEEETPPRPCNWNRRFDLGKSNPRWMFLGELQVTDFRKFHFWLNTSKWPKIRFHFRDLTTFPKTSSWGGYYLVLRNSGKSHDYKRAGTDKSSSIMIAKMPNMEVMCMKMHGMPHAKICHAKMCQAAWTHF